jgi:hypothetical protein
MNKQLKAMSKPKQAVSAYPEAPQEAAQMRQDGKKLKRSMPFSYEGKPQKADYSVDTSGYAAGKKNFPASIAYTPGKKPSWWKLGDSVETDLSRKNVDRLIKNKEPKGKLSDLKPVPNKK